ncbi:MAG: hypothetical protein AB7O97_19960 [Planctomycetota bacterium]
MADLLRVVLYGVLPALAATLLLVGLLGPRLLGLSAGLGVLVSWGLLRSRVPQWPHELWAGNNDATQWLCWCLLAIGALSACCGKRLRPAALAWVAGAGALGGEVWLMLTNLRRRMDTGELLLQHGLATAAATALWLVVRRALDHRGSAAQAWLLCACLCGDSALLLLSGSALQGQLAGAIAAAFGAAAGTALWRHPFRLDRAVALPFTAAHAGFLLAGLHFSELEWLPAVLAAVAPAGLALAGERQGGTTGASRVVLSVAAVLAPLGAAVALALAAQG